MSTREKGIISWLLVVAWMGFIFFMSANTGDGLNDGMGIISAIFQLLDGWQVRVLGDGVDLVSSVAHFLEYALLGLLLANALRFHAPSARAYLLAVLVASFYGGTDELHQCFVPGRFSDPVDWLVDTCGAVLGVFAYARICDTRDKDR